MSSETFSFKLNILLRAKNSHVQNQNVLPDLSKAVCLQLECRWLNTHAIIFICIEEIKKNDVSFH